MSTSMGYMDSHPAWNIDAPSPCAVHVQGIEEMMSSGSLAGFPVVDVKATLYDGTYHDVDSSVLAFQIAARGAFRDGMRKGAVRLLEPVMKVGVAARVCSWARTHVQGAVASPTEPGGLCPMSPGSGKD